MYIYPHRCSLLCVTCQRNILQESYVGRKCPNLRQWVSHIWEISRSLNYSAYLSIVHCLNKCLSSITLKNESVFHPSSTFNSIQINHMIYFILYKVPQILQKSLQKDLEGWLTDPMIKTIVGVVKYNLWRISALKNETNLNL